MWGFICNALKGFTGNTAYVICITVALLMQLAGACGIEEKRKYSAFSIVIYALLRSLL